MPTFVYTCSNGHTFDHLFTSISERRRLEVQKAVTCPECKSTEVTKDDVASMRGGGFSKYGLWTYI